MILLFCRFGYLKSKIYECETRSLTLKDERRMRVFENRALRNIFGPKEDKVTGEWTKLHNEELIYLKCSSNAIPVVKSRRLRWVGHVVRKWDRSGVYRDLVGKPEVKRPLRRPTHRREVERVAVNHFLKSHGHVM